GDEVVALPADHAVVAAERVAPLAAVGRGPGVDGAVVLAAGDAADLVDHHVLAARQPAHVGHPRATGAGLGVDDHPAVGPGHPVGTGHPDQPLVPWFGGGLLGEVDGEPARRVDGELRLPGAAVVRGPVDRAEPAPGG